MNKFFAILMFVVMFIAIGLWLMEPDGTTETPGYLNATYTIDGASITLTDGSLEVESTPGVITTYEFFGNGAEGDINNDGNPDAVFYLTKDTGGSGVFYYIVAALNTASGYTGTNGVLLGDRIAPQPTQIQDGEITVNYADRAPGEPFSTQPSVSVTRTFTLTSNNRLEEVIRVTTRPVQLFYYNAENDTDATGNIMCSRDGLVSVEREIPVTQTPLQDTIKLLLEGNLTEAEQAQGISTEFPLEGLSLTGANLVDGVLTLSFDDPENSTGGGSCRVGILWHQIEATALQFPDVTEVHFTPEELFQP